MPVEITRRIGATITSSATLTAGQHTPVDATSASVTVTLPPGVDPGAHLSVEKTDTGSNTVTITGSIRGTTSTVTLASQHETLEFRADATGSWWPYANNLPSTAVDAKIAAQAATDAATYATQGLTRAAASAVRGSAIATGVSTPSGTWSNVLAQNSRVRHFATRDMTSLRLLYVNFSGQGDTLTDENLTVRAGIEIGGAFYPVFFRGARSAVIEPGGSIVSDPVAVPTVAAGSTFYSRTWSSGPNGALPFMGPPISTISAWGEGTDAANGVSAPDHTISGTISASTASFYGPSAIIGPPSASPTVGVLGDSISQGLGDGTIVDAGLGWIRRALNNTLGYIHIGQSGETSYNNRYLRLPFVLGSSYVIEALGANDVNTGNTLATFQGAVIDIWKRFSVLGIRVYRSTLTPITTSTDSWATLANQTVKSNETMRTSFNDWVRDGAPILSGAPAATGSNASGTLRAGATGHPLAGYFETADAVESARNSGLWKVGSVYTGDNAGLHPNSTGHAAMAATVDLSVFV